MVQFASGFPFIGSLSGEGGYPFRRYAPPPFSESALLEGLREDAELECPRVHHHMAPSCGRRLWPGLREVCSKVRMRPRGMQSSSDQVGNSGVLPHLGSDLSELKLNVIKVSRKR